MVQRLERDLIFYHPEKSGLLFSYEAGSEVNFDIVNNEVEQLEKKTDASVACILDRRKKKRLEGSSNCQI